MRLPLSFSWALSYVLGPRSQVRKSKVGECLLQLVRPSEETDAPLIDFFRPDHDRSRG